MIWTELEMKSDEPWNAEYLHGKSGNLFKFYQKEWRRRNGFEDIRTLITREIECIFEPGYITPPETSEFIESLVTMVDARRVLEIGMYSGFTSLHILRAIIGKEGAKLTCIDGREGLFDKEFFARAEIAPWFEFICDWTPGVFSKLTGPYDVMFIDSDHSPEHTKLEFEALLPLTHPGTIFIFHDLPRWARPDDRTEPPVRKWVLEQVSNGTLYGLILPTCEQLDCKTMWGEGYPPECNPHLGVFVRR